MNVLWRVINYVANEVVVPKLASSEAFQKFALKSSEAVEKFAQRTLEAQKKLDLEKTLSSASKRIGEAKDKTEMLVDAIKQEAERQMRK
mmetsp:Transcript_38164/g.61791  ORF Transcript_38164/g.61791 Transcript_38164/m.61791 type:complete len:89 (-) Transcript_38164:834-1100(-)